MRVFKLFCLALTGFCATVFAQNPQITAEPGDKRFGEEEQINARRDWFISKRGLDQFERANELRWQAVQQTRAMRDETEGGGVAWESTGPSPMVMGNWLMGQVAGRISALAVHPGNDNVLYAGAASGGLWKSVDGGQNWTSLFDSVGTQTIGSIALDPTDPDTVWVGTGEQSNSCTGYFGLGLFRSTDGGATFVDRNGSEPNKLNSSYVTALAVHPSDSDIVFAGSSGFCDDGSGVAGGLFRTTDGGANWTEVIAGSVNDVIFHPTTPDVMYASMGRGGSESGVYKSTDGGQNWTRFETTLPFGPAAGRGRIAMAPSNPDIVYAYINRAGGTPVFRTVDGGQNWTLQNTDGCEGQCSYNLCIAVHPTDPDTILVGSLRFSKSTDGGQTLNWVTSNWGSAQSVHQDTHVLLYDNNDGDAYWVGSDGGVWKTENDGADFANLNEGLNITQFYDIAVHPDDEKIIYGGAQDNSSSWTFAPLIWDVTLVTGDGFMNLIDPADPDNVFQASYANGGRPNFFFSTNGGDGPYSGVPNAGISVGSWPWVVPMAIADLDAVTPTSLFVAGPRVYRNSVPTAGWVPWVDITGTSGIVNVSVLTPVVHNGAMMLYVGTQNGRVFRTDDALAATVNWVEVTDGLPTDWVSDIAVDPTDPMIVYVTRSRFGFNKLYRSTTGGGSWQALGADLPNIPANAVAIDPLNANRVIVGMDTGVYQSFDAGQSFAPMMNGLPEGTVVTDLEIDDNPYYLTAGTYGRGAWRIPLILEPLTAGPNSETAGCALSAIGLDAGYSGGAPPYSFAWSVVSGPDLSAGQFSDTAAETPTFTPSTAGTYQLQVAVTDNLASVVNRIVTVHSLDQAGFMAALQANWLLGDGQPGWLPVYDRNGNGLIEVLDAVSEMLAPVCP